jgi:hypothetical protein
LERAKEILGEIADVLLPPESVTVQVTQRNLSQEILGIITRHPMRGDELVRVFSNWDSREVDAALGVLQANGDIQAVQRLGEQFWLASDAHFPEDSQSKATKPKQRT